MTAARVLSSPVWRSGLLVFGIALAVRLFFFSRIPIDALYPSPDWELESIAISIAERGEFADPYAVPTGPTAHLPPIPPSLAALVYELLGVSLTAGIVVWLFRLVTQATIWALLPWIGERLGVGWKAGLLAGTAGALFPQWLAHGEALAAVLFGGLVVWFSRRLDSTPGITNSLLFGATFGVLFHVQPVFLLVLLAYIGFELWRGRDSAGRRWRSATVVLVAAFVVCVPWGIRNYRVLDAVFFVRSNFGLELRMGNHDGAVASIDHPHFHGNPPHPRTHREDALLVRELGEATYMRNSGSEAVNWIESNPGEFLRLTGERVLYFWFGPLDQPAIALLFALLALLASIGAVRVSGRLPASRAGALMVPLFAYPIVYYLVPWQHRYRFPIEWILFLLAGAAVWWPMARDEPGVPPTDRST